MSFKETVSAIGKMGKKDPLKMLFAVVMISILPLLVVGTLTEVLLRSRASGPISGATGPVDQHIRLTDVIDIAPNCQSNGACDPGLYMYVFENVSNRPIKNLRINSFYTDKVTPTGGRQPIQPPTLIPYFSDPGGTRRDPGLPSVDPANLFFVLLEPNVGESEANKLSNAVIRIIFSGETCANTSASSCTKFMESTVEISTDDAIKTIGSGNNSTPAQESGDAMFDLNNDNVLDLRDYTLMVHDFGKNGPAKFSKADLNGDGKVDKADSDQLTNQIKIKKLHKLK